MPRSADTSDTVTPQRGVDRDALHVLLVEDDAALRAPLAERLGACAGVARVTAVGTPREAIATVGEAAPDVAVIDSSLGTLEINGVELALALRGLDRGLAIVMHVPEAVGTPARIVPAGQRHHWAFARKRTRGSVDELASALRAAIDGASAFDPELVGAVPVPAIDALMRLTPRQREVIALAATGLDARAIAVLLHMAHVSVRRELSRAYKVLVPAALPGTDLRTAAVLAYLRLLVALGDDAGR